jgi:hypothetical protein
LHAEWDKKALSDLLSLLWSLIAESADPSLYPWQGILEFGPHLKSAKNLNQEIVSRIRELSVVFTDASLPAMPSNFTPRKSRAATLAEQAWAYLVLQALAKIEGETGLLMDSQSLLFLCSIHYLLPQLRQQGLAPEHDCLVHAMYVHTVLVWRSQPAHLFYLQGLIMDYLGDHLKRLELLRYSLRLTPVNDHSYLTKATAYWADLLDLGKKQEALDFLLSLNRSCPLAYQDEIGKMISETICGAPEVAV